MTVTRGVSRALQSLRGPAGRCRLVLRLRTSTGHETAARNLELLAAALRAMGWRCVELYAQEDGLPVPLLWVYASSGAGNVLGVGAAVSVRATPGGTWAYFEAGKGRGGFLSPCDDATSAAGRVGLLLKYRMFPNTEWISSFA